MATSPGDRLDMKLRVARSLAQQEWYEVDLILREFGFPNSSNWNGPDLKAYVLEMLGSAEAGAHLDQLDDYLHPTAVKEAPPQPQVFDDPTSPWRREDFRLFISHVHDYAEHAAALRAELGKRSVDAFVAHDDIEPTQDWHETIRYALKSCDACLALLTPGFEDSQWTDQEVGWCIGRGLLVVPLEFGLTPYGFLGKYQSLKIKQGMSPEDISLGVFELLVRKEQSRRAMAQALVARWERTDSFDGARENYGFLMKVPADVWDQELADRVWEARERNVDLREASIDWKESDVALNELLGEPGFQRPSS